ncbi:MAG: glycosyltransferase, partial [Flavobacteriales bacterium]|nr:glycosyltransferase [Flavobacteriales bacterium]
MHFWPPETWLLAGALLVLLLFHAAMFAPFVLRKATVEPDRDLPVSVLICARNAAHDLERLLPLVMDQDHRDFEVVVVNDRSDDETGLLLDQWKRRYPALRPVTIQADEKFSYGKKLALGVGIRAARHPHVLLTDADCTPAGRDWVATMAAGFRSAPGAPARTIVVGHSPYAPAPGLVNVLERYDGSVKALQYMAFAGAGFPYMGVG